MAKNKKGLKHELKDRLSTPTYLKCIKAAAKLLTSMWITALRIANLFSIFTT